jgi:predicted DNA-binding transcriptional regulator AlpA
MTHPEPANDRSDSVDRRDEHKAMTQAPTPLPRKSVARARQLGRFVILDQPVVSAEEAFAMLRIDRSTGYKAIRDGTFPLPVVRIGRVIRIPTAALVKLLNPERDLDSTGEPKEQQA